MTLLLLPPTSTETTSNMIPQQLSSQDHDRCSDHVIPTVIIHNDDHHIHRHQEQVLPVLPPPNDQRYKNDTSSSSYNNYYYIRWSALLVVSLLFPIWYTTTTMMTTKNARLPYDDSFIDSNHVFSNTNQYSRQRIQQQQQDNDDNSDNTPWVLRINAGSDQEEIISSSSSSSTTSSWMADTYYSGGRRSTTNIDIDTLLLYNYDNNQTTIMNTTTTTTTTLSNDDWYIFETYRTGSFLSGNQFQYHIPVRNGIYNVTFYFMEPDPTRIVVGERKFDIYIEQNTKDSIFNIDIVNLTNYYSNNDHIDDPSQSPQPLVLQLSKNNITVRDGILTMEFRRTMDHIPRWAILRRLWYRYIRTTATSTPIVSGIEITLDTIPLSGMGNSNLTLAPIGPPVPSPISTPPTTQLETIRINIGATTMYTDPNTLITWLPDQYYTGGQILPVTIDDDDDENNNINRTGIMLDIPPTVAIDRTVLLSMRTGTIFRYNIPVPPGNYDIRMYFVEYNRNITMGERIFDIRIETITVYENLDILARTNGISRTALVLSKPYEVTDGDVTIEFVSLRGGIYLPIVSAIEVELLGVHYAHAVTGGPYRGVIDPKTNGFATINVNGNPSHTHAPGLQLVDYVWKLVPSVLAKNGTIIGRGEITTLSLPIGEHIVVLTVTDNGGNDSSDVTTVTVYGTGYPDVTNIVPKNGPIFGGNFVTIIGSGFIFPSNVTVVQFGTQNLTGSRIQIINANTIKLRVPSVKIPSLIPVSVITPNGESKTAIYSYESSVPIRFNSAKLVDIEKPLRIKFGPDGTLYVSTGKGQIVKIKLDDEYNVVDIVFAQVTRPNRFITGLAFDPTDPDPTRIYFVHNDFFHGAWKNTCRDGINAKISTAQGERLNKVTDVVTGLPVADLDHGIMAIEFGDYGELYIGSGSNTNGGIPGPLTSKSLQKDTVLNSAILVAHIHKPGFNGTITYDADDDGNQVGALGFVEVYAPGLRNPFGMVLHSNTNLYVTDNGPNIGYGKMAMGCDGKTIPDAEEEDRLHLIEPGRYYGQPNLKRGLTDPRQCVWRMATEARTTANGYTPPIGRPLSSTTGVLEYHADHFDGQLRYSLITALYQGGLYRTILSADGRSVLPESVPPVLLTGEGTLDITQGPDGSMFDTRYLNNEVYVYKPFQFFVPSVPTIYTVFPRRGSFSGGTLLTIYGVNLWSSSSTTKILMGENECVISVTPIAPSTKKIQCVVPPNRIVDDHVTVDIVAIVSNNPTNAIFKNGYRYITGKPKEVPIR